MTVTTSSPLSLETAAPYAAIVLGSTLVVLTCGALAAKVAGIAIVMLAAFFVEKIASLSKRTIEPITDFRTFEGTLLPEPLRRVREGNGYQAAYWNPLPAVVERTITSDLPNGIVRSWKPNCPIPLRDLAYVRVTHANGPDNFIGELIVHKNVADEVIDIFRELFAQRFPIERMRLIDFYNADDDRSMEANNTSAFCSREITLRPGKFSTHSYGMAIDINPLINPYVNRLKNIVCPEGGKAYLLRTHATPGMIQKGDACYRAFVNRKWQWGGNWNNPVDYQHFERPLRTV